MKDRYAILGYPLSHSVSPQIHNRAFSFYNLQGEYTKLSIAPNEFEEMISRLKEEDWKGFNVTIPFKERILKQLDRIEPAAGRIGAVNTIKTENGKWSGYNTDYYGFLEPLSQVSTNIKTVLIFGAGGAARAVLYGLLAAIKPEKIFIVNRTVERAEALIRDMGKPLKAEFQLITFQEIHDVRIHFDLLINTTSLGTLGKDNLPELNLEKIMQPSGILYDLVYNPPSTAFLEQGRAGGYVTINGLPMLLGQAAAAFKIWTGLDYPSELLSEFYKDFG